jgi:glutamate dehydrogenase
MALRAEEAKAAIVEQAIAQIRERMPSPQAAQLERFVRDYYAAAAPEDVAEIDAYGAALAHWTLLQRRLPGETKVHVYTPRAEEHGWQSTHSVVEIVTDDMPFLVDSVSMTLTGRGIAIHNLVHPMLEVTRDEDGRLRGVGAEAGGAGKAGREAVMHLEIDRCSDQAVLDDLAAELRRVLADVRAAVEDWRAMRARVDDAVEELARRSPRVDPDELAEAKALLEWLADDHFTFLGYREYALQTIDGEDALSTVPGTGLGILREKAKGAASPSFKKLPPNVRRLAREPNLLNLTKANARSTVHRPTQLDYVGIKRFDDEGAVVGERRFLGLFTSTAYSASPWEIPVLRRKVRSVLDRSGLVPASHDYKALVEILETYPRDELFQIGVDDLFETALGVVRLGERRRVRLFCRRDVYERFVSCLVYLPLERYDTQTRLRIQALLRDAFNGDGVDHAARVSESALARLHLIVQTRAGEIPAYDVGELEARLAAATRSWKDDLRDALVDDLGEERGVALFERYADAFPPAYRDDFGAHAAVADIERIERLDPAGDLDMSLYLPLASGVGRLAFKLLRSGAPILLSDVLPLLENMGVRVVDERPFEVKPQGGPTVWIYDFGLDHDEDVELQTDRLRQVFQEAFAHVWRGELENDGFNRLVLGAALTWREIALLRAISKYLRQASSTFSQAYMEETLAANADVARLCVELFDTRFRPPRQDATDAKAHALVREIESKLDAVASLDEDRILRSFLRVVQAMLRTNYFQSGAGGEPKPHLSFKLDPAGIPDLPAPRPRYEIFVYSPRTEGLHLRAGPVARGGIRWSDRREDFRTEILGLAKAQTVKNAVIVPTGAKGGFVVKQPPADREALREEVVECYRTLVRGLLDLTDTLAGGEVKPPSDVVRYDGDDPYLVVAADKGTATFSDVANALAAEYGFWLGDAFASGGSTGYDHKRMGITARGAWESVKRHFRELGTDAETEEISAVGIGDMSGDVFGNGMLLSRRLRLVAAFDHRHVFLDPNPDPARSYDERARLFALPASSWADYDASLISRGGGVFPRTAKSIDLSAEVRAALGVEASTLPPSEVVRAILRAPVDLLWNGGIGTFVKARGETHAEVGDRASDAIRVDAEELRCRVVGEGGNLGLTQRARVAYALRGGRVNMDAIDNSAGVDCSDHEVNIKILLDAIVRDGDLTEKQRNALLTEMTDEVAEIVLRDNYEQTQLISTSVAQAASMVDVHARYIRSLEQAGKLDRALEFLPDDEELSARKAAGHGLTTPELAILLSYTKIVLSAELLASELPDEPYLQRELEKYFPAPVRERFARRLAQHPLRREIVAAQLTNSLVNRGGTTFAFRLAEETGATAADIARAFAAAREIFELRDLWTEIESLDGRVAAQTQTRMLLRARTLLERSTRWLLRNQPRPLDLASAVERFRPSALLLAEAMPQLLAPAQREVIGREADELADGGVPRPAADRVSQLRPLFATLDVVEVARESGLDVESAAALYFRLGDALELQSLHERIADLPRQERWEALARRALWDDLQAEWRALAADVLHETREDRDGDRLTAWLSRNALPVERCLQVLADVKADTSFDLATLSVAVREIRNLIDASSVEPVGRS